jgi:outer membrane lipoprotein SlyB
VEKTVNKKFLSAALAITTIASGLAVTPAMARHRDGGYYGYDNSGYNGGYCRRDKGTGGAIIGAVAGGLAGREIARRDRTAGTIIGAAVGALAGRAIDKSDSPCRRR